MKKERIWELDALRGLCILAVVAVHLVYDLVELYELVPWTYPAWFVLVKEWGGIIFFLISGISATLGSRHVRRGLVVFACGMVCTAVTWGMTRLGMADKSFVIWFGVLHCLGVCMVLWSLLRALPMWLTAALAAALAAVGLYWELASVRGEQLWMIPLGVPTYSFSSPDYFPLLPFLGFFLLGTVLGRLLYAKKRSLLPLRRENCFPVRFLCACGRQSLLIYLLHQPILTGLCTVIQWLR